MSSLAEKIARRASGICLYGIAPPKQATSPDRLQAIVAAQRDRIRTLRPDGLVVYDIQDEPGRSGAPRPFPFLPTLDPGEYAHGHLGELDLPKVVYRAVGQQAPEAFVRWCESEAAAADPRFSVLVGASATGAPARLRLDEAYALVRRHAPQLVLGGIAIAERHTRKGDEHLRMIAKEEQGCRFFVTQAVYDVTSTKSLLSDYFYALQARGAPPVPVILTFSPCGSPKTLELMRWLGISIPRWLENELLHHGDILARSVDLCESIAAEVASFAREKQLPIGINVESVSPRREEIDASVALWNRLRGLVA